MARVLTVIFGAGASYDCNARYSASEEILPRVPLTQRLLHNDGKFDKKHGFKNHILRKFNGAASIGQIYQSNSASGFEDFLKSLLDSGDPNMARQVYQTKFFLREYLGVLSEFIQAELTTTNYANLIHHFSQLNFDKILLITTNYDLLLDYYLFANMSWNFSGVQDYIGNDSDGHQNKWFYVKLHGSVNWRKRVDKEVLDKMRPHGCVDLEDLVKNHPKLLLDAPGENEVLKLHSMEGLPRNEDTRGNNNQYMFDIGHQKYLYAPIMVLPHDKKEYICDKTHYEKAITLMSETTELWIVGNSLIDPDIKEMLSKIPYKDKGLKISIVDPLDDMYWIRKLKELFPKNHDFISYQNANTALTGFIHDNLSFRSPVRKLSMI